MGRTLRALLSALLLLAVASPTRAKDRVIEIRMQDVRLEAVECEEVTRKVCKKVLTECRKAYATIANRLALNSARIFFIGEDLPMWLSAAVRKDPTFCVVVKPRFSPDEMGAEAYLERMENDRFVINLPAPGEELTPEDIHRIWREMTYAIVAQTSWRACPLWLREGLAERMAEIGTDGEHTLLATLEEQLVEGVERLQVEALLRTTDREAWGRSAGRAVSWAVVHMLDETNVKLVPALFNQNRLLLRHLVFCEKPQTALLQHTETVFQQLEASGVKAELFEAALAGWIRNEFPEGSAYRKTDSHRSLRKLKLPLQYGTAISGRFGNRLHVEDAYGILRHYQPFTTGKVAWRLPWPSTMEVFVGVRGKPGVNYALRPDKSREGYYFSYSPWRAGRKGEQYLEDQTMELPRMLCKYGFIWVGVISPRGLGYIFQSEYLLK